MKKELTREQLEELYLPPADEFVEVDVPDLPFFMVDGEGSPDEPAFQHTLRWLWAAVHPLRQEAKRRMGRGFVEPPLEALWWADDTADLWAGRKDRLKWRLMVPGPEWATQAMFADAVAEAAQRLDERPESLRLDRLHEGRCLQILHVGPNADEMPTIRRLHGEVLPARGLVAHGPHHEIYLNDPKRTAPARRKTVLRQPVRPA